MCSLAALFAMVVRKAVLSYTCTLFSICDNGAMRTSPPTTPLLAILRQMTPQQRLEFATLAGTKVDYLYQLAGCNRTSCRSALAMRIASASEQMALLCGSAPIGMSTLAVMCSESGCAV